MQIVTDTAMDLYLPPEELPAVQVHVVPQMIALNGSSYRSGVDIQHTELYRLLAETDIMPGTSLPSAGDFAEVYRRLAASDPDILSIHVSGRLSGTIGAARAGAAMVPEARVTVVDSRNVSAVMGWQVAAAARAIAAGRPVRQIISLIEGIGAVSESLFTTHDLKYLIHGGRIGHMKGLVAAALRIKPLIGLAGLSGVLAQRGIATTFKGALDGLVRLITRRCPLGAALRVQVGHTFNPEGAAMLRERIDRLFECVWLPTATLSPVLGAHAGPSLVGVAFSPLADFMRAMPV